MRHANLMGTVLALGVATGLVTPQAVLADDITLNVPVRLTRMAANVTRGIVTCQVNGTWETLTPRGSGNDLMRQTFRASGTSEFTIDGTSGEYNETRTVRISTPAPPQSWLDAGNQIWFVDQQAYYCKLQVGAAGSAWQPQTDVAPGARGAGATFILVNTSPPAAWAESRSASDALLVYGALSVPPR